MIISLIKVVPLTFTDNVHTISLCLTPKWLRFSLNIWFEPLISLTYKFPAEELYCDRLNLWMDLSTYILSSNHVQTTGTVTWLIIEFLAPSPFFISPVNHRCLIPFGPFLLVCLQKVRQSICLNMTGPCCWLSHSTDNSLPVSMVIFHCLTV